MSANPKTGDLLIEAKLIDEGQLETALGFQKARGGKLGEILVSLNYLSEEELLETLSGQLGLKLFSAEDLADQHIDNETKGAIPRFLAEEELILPLEFNRAERSLVLLTHEPLDDSTLEGLRIFAGVDDIETCLTTKASMRKLLALHLGRTATAAEAAALVPDQQIRPPAPLAPTLGSVVTSPAARTPVAPPASEPAEAGPPGSAVDDLVSPGEGATETEPSTGWDGSEDGQAKVIPIRPEETGGSAPTPEAAPAEDATPVDAAPAEEAPTFEPEEVEAAPEPEAAPVDEEASDGAAPQAQADDVHQGPPPPDEVVTPEAVASASAGAPPASSAPTFDLRRGPGRRVLVVSADEEIRATATAGLAAEGLTAVSAADAAEVRTLDDLNFDDLYLDDVGSAGAIALTQMLRGHNPQLRVRDLADRSDEQGWTMEQFQFFFDLWDIALRLLGDRWSDERRHARARAELARALAQEMGLPARRVDEVYLGTYVLGLDELLEEVGFREEGMSATRALLNRASCPYDLDVFLGDLPASPAPAEGVPVELRIAAAAGAFLAAQIEAGIGVRETIERIPWAYEAPGLTAALLRTLARRGELVLPEAQRGREVLLVDPDEFASGVLWLRFASEGLGARLFGDGQAALDHIRGYGTALVISEIELPELGGLDLCTQVKSADDTRHVKFFFLTGDARPELITKGLEAGAEDFLVKPVNLELLVIKTKRAMMT